MTESIRYQIPVDVRGQHFGNIHEGEFAYEAGEVKPTDEAERELLDYLVSIGAAVVAQAGTKRTRQEV